MDSMVFLTANGYGNARSVGIRTVFPEIIYMSPMKISGEVILDLELY